MHIPQPIAQTSIATHGTPARRLRSPITFGRKPSAAIATGTREYERISALNIENAEIIPPAVIAIASISPTRGRIAPPTVRPTSTHDPVSQLSGAMPVRAAAAMGMT